MKKEPGPYSGTPFDLTGKTALVSGGAGLLGAEFCKALASAGANIVLADNDKKKMKNTTKEIQRTLPEISIIARYTDVTDQSSIDECIDLIKSRYGQLDILVNSAAVDPKFEKNSDISKFSSFPNFPKELWQYSIDVNLTGTFLLTQKVCKLMEKKKRGSIINLGSNYGLVGPDQRIYKKKNQSQQTYKPVVYSVCKAGIIGFTKYLATYYAGTKIRVNLLTPGGVYNNHDKDFADNYAQRTVLRRMSDKKEFWGGVIFLASDASSYMTGGNLVIDGGWTAL
ncbi:MAG: SDR family oxidoreductase [Planctomycetes bacterium]|nr:SDR family oxidoreductase [Planctomycetota bacterium]